VRVRDGWVARASRVLVSASRRNDLSFDFAARQLTNVEEKFAIARTRSPARETHALPGIGRDARCYSPMRSQN